MPLIKQPLSLEIMSLRKCAVWLCEIAQQLMPIVRNLTREDIDKKFLKRLIPDLKEVFEYNIPFNLYDKLLVELFMEITKLIEQINKHFHMKTQMAKFLSQVHIAISLSEIFFSSNLRNLGFDSVPKMMRHLFYTNLCKFTGLTSINLGSMSGGWKTNDMEPIILKGLSNMNNLTSLTLNYDCTNHILERLNENCKKLRYIDLTNSKSIDNDSMDILIQLKQLNVVHLHRTSVGIDGYIKCLMNLPHLYDVGRYDDLGKCLSCIDDFFPNCPKLKLKKFITHYATTHHLQLLAERCPDIYMVSIFHNVLLIDLMQLIGLNCLSELKLLSCDFFADQIRNVLEIKGCNITYLHLEHVDEIDMNALMYITQFCPDLKKLVMYNCELIDSTSLYTSKLAIPPFINLEHLTFVVQCSRIHIEFVLSRALKIKFIHLGTMVDSTDILFDNILLYNPLAHLEELRIMNSDFLTINTAYKLVETCDKLCRMNELESWNMVKEEEFNEFKQFLKNKNLDIDITPLRRFQQ